MTYYTRLHEDILRHTFSKTCEDKPIILHLVARSSDDSLDIDFANVKEYSGRVQ